jgi:calcineurin-like phosphoesterase family protein
MKSSFESINGYAIIINVNHDKFGDIAQTLFWEFYVAMKSFGFEFENRIFYKLGDKSSIEHDFSKACIVFRDKSKISLREFFTSSHMIPLNEFIDLSKVLLPLY